MCGFNNELCKKDDTHYTSTVAAVVLGVLLFCSGVVTMSIYRKWKIELEIEGLLWKIDIVEIKGYSGNEIVSSPSKVSNLNISILHIQYYISSFNCSGQLDECTELWLALVPSVCHIDSAFAGCCGAH